VVTSFLFRTHPAKMVYGGPIIFDFADAREVMRWYRGFQAEAADDFSVWLGLQTVPPGAPFPEEHWGKKMCVLLVAHSGANAEADVDALRAELPKPLIDWAGPLPYTALQQMFDALYPKGLQWYWKGDFVRDLPDAAIDTHLKHASEVPTPISAMHLYPIDGAVARRPSDETAWHTRDATWSMVIVGVGSDPAQAPQLRRWASDYWQDVHRYNLAGAYPYFMMDDEGEERIHAAFGDNYPRLAALKGKYDPQNLFHINQNIRPRLEDLTAGLHA
jgi:hypothetical protein